MLSKFWKVVPSGRRQRSANFGRKLSKICFWDNQTEIEEEPMLGEVELCISEEILECLQKGDACHPRWQSFHRWHGQWFDSKRLRILHILHLAKWRSSADRFKSARSRWLISLIVISILHAEHRSKKCFFLWI